MLPPWSCQCSWDFCYLIPVYVKHFQPLWRSWSIVYLQPLWRSWSFLYLHHGDSDLCILYVAMTTHVIFVSCLFMAIVLLCIRDCYMYLQLYGELYYCTMLIGWLVFHFGFFITRLLGWTYNVFRPSYDPYNLTHYGASIIADFTTLGESHLYGLSLVPL